MKKSSVAVSCQAPFTQPKRTYLGKINFKHTSGVDAWMHARLPSEGAKSPSRCSKIHSIVQLLPLEVRLYIE
jgi:hypothetical protein